jgi:shikimate dehydrogenase
MRHALVIGSPITHARSPIVHGYWLSHYGIDGNYGRERVEEHEVAAFLRELSGRGFVGCNVTIPNKEAAFRACDRVTDRARAIGAVNTVWFEGPAIWGDNTDGAGFVAHLNQTHPDWADPRPNILILGTGGAARGLALPLLAHNPARLVFCNRSTERAEALCGDIRPIYPDARIEFLPWDERVAALPGYDLVINTTSLGMAGQDPLDLPLRTAKSSSIIADIVYVPLETLLLAEARERRLRTLDGLGMLLHQAVPGFERWFGLRPEVTEDLRRRVIADL